MPRADLAGKAIIFGCAAALAIGLFAIFQTRLSSGSLYPAYSSLRADAEGTKLLFDGLSALDGVAVTRAFKPLAQARAQGAAILILGYSSGAFEAKSDAELTELEDAAKNGNRLVIAFDPGRVGFIPRPDQKPPLEKRWGVQVKPFQDEMRLQAGMQWTVLRSDSKGSLAIERGYGNGSVVLAADARPFRNLELAKDRDTALLTELIGPRNHVVFDEAHLGVQDSGSVLGLAHRYRLDGVLWGLIVLAGVFIWSRSIGFPPAVAPRTSGVTGYDVKSGLVHLLRRQIPPARVVDVCVAEWQRTQPRRALAATASSTGDPIARYHSFQQETARK